MKLINSFTVELSKAHAVLPHIPKINSTVKELISFINKGVTWDYEDKYQPSYNVSPGKYQPVIIYDQQENITKLVSMHWGLIPSFINNVSKNQQQQVNHKPNNARAESIDKNPMFSRLLLNNRCVIVSQGFFEWKHYDNKEKQPYFIKHQQQQQQDIKKDHEEVKLECKIKIEPNEENVDMSIDESYNNIIINNNNSNNTSYKTEVKDEKNTSPSSPLPASTTPNQTFDQLYRKEYDVMFFGGVYDKVIDPYTKEVQYSYSIITLPSSGSNMSWLHHRIPLILDPSHLFSWLTNSNSGVGGGSSSSSSSKQQSISDAIKLIKLYQQPLEIYPVTKLVGKSSYDTPQNIVKLDNFKAQPDIRSFFKKKDVHDRDDDGDDDDVVKGEYDDKHRTIKSEGDRKGVVTSSTLSSPSTSPTKIKVKKELPKTGILRYFKPNTTTTT
eukprot:TRINITY_DN124_c2_g3_i1.p1 TRINITY_DN124_c2_g3~~TRINITY_DN124_c2_g3_i1.p1  ORF type:complete len:441 (+),score=153.05 TRINITY_DN124_c2_g3_i1:1036-2358(+)